MSGGPLDGKVVLVTRPAPQGAALAERLRDLGAEAIEAPAIVIQGPKPGGALDEAVRDAAGGAYEWVIFTSAVGVVSWFERADATYQGPPRGRSAAVGDATADALRFRGVEPDLVPNAFTTAALGEAFPAGTGRVLLARADLATEVLEQALRAKGWTPTRVDAYRTGTAEALPEAARTALDRGMVDAVTFTSPSTIAGFVDLAGVPDGVVAVAIGPVTGEAARRAGFRVAEEADPHTEDGLVDAVLRALTRSV
ncbi:MAG: uroporphyrinogen-III synthase [Actinomycetota bacterium]